MPIIVKSAIPVKWTPETPVVLGIDEAGRGPVLGPMVYACAFWPVDEEEEIAKYGFDDSKALTEAKREQLFKRMADCGVIGYLTHSITAREISTAMLHRTPISLNAISHDAAMLMIEDVLRAGVRVEKVFVDTVGEPGYYQSKLQKAFNSGSGGGGGQAGRGWPIEFTVSKKADSLYKCVSAASIAAKVTRDAAIAEWVFDEPAFSHITPPAMLSKDERRAASAGKGKGKKAAAAAAVAATAAADDNDDEQGDAADDGMDEEDDDAGGAAAGGSGYGSGYGAGAGAATGGRARKAAGGQRVIEDSDDDDDNGEDSVAANENAGDVGYDEDGAYETGGLKRQKSGDDSSPSTGAADDAAAAPAPVTSANALHPITSGSGYPSDPLTKAWLKTHLDPVFGWPSVARFSWAPARDALDTEPAVKVDWGDDEDEAGGAGGDGQPQAKVTAFFTPSSSSAAATGTGSKGRCAWMRKRHIEPVTVL